MSFYTSLNGMKNAQTDLGVIAHNIANVDTNGFKKSSTQFADIVVGSAQVNPRMVQGIGARLESITQNFALGPIEQTGSALDMAITGDGFFTTRSVESGRTLYTRNGAFTRDDQGFIQDGSNNRLQVFPTDNTGAITSMTPVDASIPATNAAGSAFAGITVGSDGRVTASYADGSFDIVGTVSLAAFNSPGCARSDRPTGKPPACRVLPTTAWPGPASTARSSRAHSNVPTSTSPRNWSA